MQQQINDVKGPAKDMAEELTPTHEDMRYLRRSMDILVRNDAAQEAALKPSPSA